MGQTFCINADDRARLLELARTAHTQTLAQRCHIVLASATAGRSASMIAREFGTTPATVRRWQHRFLTGGPDGLTDTCRPGAPRQIGAEQRSAILALHAGGLNSRAIAAETGASQSSVSRIIREACGTDARPPRSPIPVEKVVERLTVTLFESLADETPLSRFLDAVEAATGADYSIMMIFTKDKRQPSLILSKGQPLEGSADYIARHYDQELLDGLPEGTVTTVSDRLTRDELRRTALYREYLVQYGVGYILGIDIGSVRGISGKFRLARLETGADFGARERAICQGLVPYLRAALQLFVQRIDMEAEKEALALTVSGMSVGSILVDSDGLILEANPPAQALLKQRDGLFATSTGKLALHSAGQSRELHDLIRRNAAAAIDPAAPGAPRAMPVNRPSGRDSIGLLVRPARGSSHNPLAIRPTALVHLVDPAQPRMTMINALMELFGLTPAEARVALSLANGHSIGETARNAATSRNTVRSQVRSIFSKMGINRQSQLIRTALISVALFSLPGDGQPAATTATAMRE